MARVSRTAVVHGGFVLFAILLAGRSAKVQILDRGKWRDRARSQHEAGTPIPAPRGMILDASGAMLVESRQLVRLEVAPREVAGLPKLGTVVPKPKAAGTIITASRRKKTGPTGVERLATLRATLTAAGVDPAWVAKASDTTRAYAVVPGRFLASDVQAISASRGIYVKPILERVPPATDGLRRLVGRADEAGEPVDGLEKAMDAVLRGTPGRAALMKDARGGSFDSPGFVGVPSKPGSTVVLTINQSLQDIAERSLADAVHQLGATGGDIVMLDPQTGEVRAMASRRADPLSTGATALTEPYEPGSTLKPFVAARLLDLKRARVDEVINTYNGKWELNGRKIVDDHAAPSFSLADVIRFSSNIGIVQFAQRLAPAEQYEMLRDLGFGSQTGLPYPGESQGVLRTPKQWDKQTAASLSMGYALNVTPLQLAAAYAAIANGGELLEPSIVKEVRTSTGEVQYTHTRRVVRRVMTPEAAHTVLGLLRGVVESGTAELANLATFDVAGKTGTARRTENGKYVNGKYTASFVGIFPADKPQIVLLVKLDNPTKTIYGGKAAAPVSKAVLQAAIAARDASFDRRDLAAAPARAAATVALTDSVASADSIERSVQAGRVPFVVDLSSTRNGSAAVVVSRGIPDVHGLPVRRAVYALHRAGFRVSIGGDGEGTGPAGATVPAAGVVAPAGTVVRLFRGS